MGPRGLEFLFTVYISVLGDLAFHGSKREVLSNGGYYATYLNILFQRINSIIGNNAFSGNSPHSEPFTLSFDTSNIACF